MSDEAPQPDQPESEKPAADAATEPTSTDAAAETPAEAAADEAVETAPTGTPDFQELRDAPRTAPKSNELNRLYDVQVTISAELGRTNVPVQELLGFTEGSVFELNRAISSPIELIAQGIPLGNGEVVVVDDTFAIRIKEIYSSQS